jgi:hypothetical protein
MQRRHRVVALTVALALLVVAPPAQAGPPERVEVPHLSALVSFDDGVVIIWNSSLADFCVWLEQGGPPPALQPITWQFTDTGQGATVVAARGEASVELWRFEGVFDVEQLCVSALSGDAPWATGTARLQFNDNDRFESGTRTNSYGAHAQGKVRDAAGTRWHVSWNWRGIIEPL